VCLFGDGLVINVRAAANSHSNSWRLS
jgi:hypothetical protein